MCDGPLVVPRGADVLRDSRVLVVAVVVAPHRRGVVQELPGEQRLHLQHTEVRTSNTGPSAGKQQGWAGSLYTITDLLRVIGSFKI